MSRALENGFAGRELEPRDALGDDELQQRRDDRGPQHGGAEHVADEARSGEIAAADARSGEQHARADQREEGRGLRS